LSHAIDYQFGALGRREETREETKEETREETRGETIEETRGETREETLPWDYT
jgi:hypothetical protein